MQIYNVNVYTLVQNYFSVSRIMQELPSFHITPKDFSSRAESMSEAIGHFTNSAVLGTNRTVTYGSKMWHGFEGKTRITNVRKQNTQKNILYVKS